VGARCLFCAHRRMPLGRILAGLRLLCFNRLALPSPSHGFDYSLARPPCRRPRTTPDCEWTVFLNANSGNRNNLSHLTQNLTSPVESWCSIFEVLGAAKRGSRRRSCLSVFLKRPTLEDKIPAPLAFLGEEVVVSSSGLCGNFHPAPSCTRSEHLVYRQFRESAMSDGGFL
jgi:hypothetical protein